MSTLERIACRLGRRDEVPNQELARDLTERGDLEGIAELVAGLSDADHNVRSDCLKALYEVGYLRPELIAPYTGAFLRLLVDKNSRMVWGGMIALATIAPLRPDEVFAERQRVEQAMAQGSVITVDNGVRILSAVAAAKDEYRRALFPFLLDHLRTCRPKDVPQHAEAIAGAVDAETAALFVAVLEGRMQDMSSSQAARVRRIIKEAGRRGRA